MPTSACASNNNFDTMQVAHMWKKTFNKISNHI